MKNIIGIILSVSLTFASTVAFPASYIAATVSNGAPGMRSAVQLWNTAPFTYCLSSVYFSSVAHTGNQLTGADLRLVTTMVGTLYSTGYNTIDYSESRVQLRIASLIPSAIPKGPLLDEIWSGGLGNGAYHPYKNMLVIPPGKGLIISNAVDGESTAVTVEYEDC